MKHYLILIPYSVDICFQDNGICNTGLLGMYAYILFIFNNAWLVVWLYRNSRSGGSVFHRQKLQPQWRHWFGNCFSYCSWNWTWVSVPTYKPTKVCFFYVVYSFSMLHDGENNDCPDDSGFIMNAVLSGGSGLYMWSSCSADFLSAYLRYFCVLTLFTLQKQAKVDVVLRHCNQLLVTKTLQC